MAARVQAQLGPQAEITIDHSKTTEIRVGGKMMKVRLIHVKFDQSGSKTMSFWAYGDLQHVAETVNTLAHQIQANGIDFDEFKNKSEGREIRLYRSPNDTGGTRVRLFMADGNSLVDPLGKLYDKTYSKNEYEVLRIYADSLKKTGRSAPAGRAAPGSPALEIVPAGSPVRT